uniref:Uncharacterized protein n=1 Tax=Magallana gigas TaxID=29159 RepID=K1QMM6_MAGGI
MEPFLYLMASLSHHWDRLLCSEEARTDNRSPPQSAHQLMPGLQGLINDLPTNRQKPNLVVASLRKVSSFKCAVFVCLLLVSLTGVGLMVYS